MARLPGSRGRLPHLAGGDGAVRGLGAPQGVRQRGKGPGPGCLGQRHSNPLAEELCQQDGGSGSPCRPQPGSWLLGPCPGAFQPSQPWAQPIRAPHSAPQHGSHCEPPAQVHRQWGAGGDQAVAPCTHWVLPTEAAGQVKPCQVSGPVRRGSSEGAACPTSTQPSRSKKLLSRAGLPPVGWRRWW